MPTLTPLAENIITSALLILSISSLWLGHFLISIILFSLFILFGLFSGALEPNSLLSIFTLGLFIYLFYKQPMSDRLKLLVFIILLLLCLGFGLHAFPGFNSWQVHQQLQLSSTAAPFSILYHYDKALVGLFIIAALSTRLNQSIDDWKTMFSKMLKTMFIGIFIIYTLSFALNYARFDLSFDNVFIPWAIKNLFLVVIAEEAYFRGLIQNQLQLTIKHRHAGLISVFIAGILFGIAHIAGGMTYVFLASVAGVLYGFVYYKTKRIEAAIATHFLLNCGHFLFFTYPYYQG